MTRHSLVLVAAASIAAMATTTVMAKDGQGRRGNIFKKADLDKDGKLTVEELVQQATSRFDRTDANKDGEITAEELAENMKRRRNERRARRMLERMDYNGDGKVTKAELEEQAKKRFALLDGNEDGFVERAEMRKAFFSMRRGGDRRKKRRGSDNL
ncbi:MAG: acid-shock protein [Rhizobiaceae bacterium]